MTNMTQVHIYAERPFYRLANGIAIEEMGNEMKNPQANCINLIDKKIASR